MYVSYMYLIIDGNKVYKNTMEKDMTLPKKLIT